MNLKFIKLILHKSTLINVLNVEKTNGNTHDQNDNVLNKTLISNHLFIFNLPTRSLWIEDLKKADFTGFFMSKKFLAL